MQAIDTQDKQFHDGNGTTELGTILPAWWLNQIQAEMLAVLSAANIAPNKAKTNQLAQAIQTLFPNKNFTLTAGAGLTGGGDLSANRTIGLATPSTLSGSTTNWVGNGATGHTHEIAKATPTVAGVVKLLNVLNSTATDAALTAAQGKELAEQITAAVSNSNNRVAKTGDTMTGLLSINTGNAWARMQFGTNDGNWKMEFDPKGAASRQMNFNFNDTTGERTFIRFPALEKGVNQLVAYQSWVHEQNPQNRSGINLDTATTPQFFINAQSANPLPVGGDWAGLVIGYPNDCTQIITAGGNMWVRGSDHNPISDPSHWSEWKRLLDESNGVMQSDFAHSRATNGYQKLPSGLILQWGTVSIKNDSYIATTFPIAFPNACFNVQVTIDMPSIVSMGSVVSAHVGDISRTGCSVGFSEIGYIETRPLYWFAIGY